jgi:DNA-directed RNA polymerase subunit RPC12/RpoP
VEKCPEAYRSECSVCGYEWDAREVGVSRAVACPSCGVRFSKPTPRKDLRCARCPTLPIERIRNTTPEGKLLGRMLEMEVDVQLGICTFADVNFEERECLRIIAEERLLREREQMDEQRLEQQMGQLQAANVRRAQERGF